MAEEQVERHTYSPKGLAAALVKDKGFHDGLWMLYVEFQLMGVNSGPNAEEVYPTAVVPIVKVGLQRVSEPNPLTVDAAVVYPNPSKHGKGESDASERDLTAKREPETSLKGLSAAPDRSSACA